MRSVLYLILPVALQLTGTLLFAQRKDNQLKKELTMETLTMSKNKEIIRNLYEQVLNARQFDLFDDIVADEYIGADGLQDKNGFKHMLQEVTRCFPDIKWTIHDLMADGDKIVVRWTSVGTHKKDFNGLPASHHVITNYAIVIYQLKNQMITQAWIQIDQLGALQQMGFIPKNLAALPNKDQQLLIDKFFVPKNAISVFEERMAYNRNFIKDLPGFIKDTVYKRIDEEGNLICVTIAQWESMEAINNAKEAVQAEYKRINFNMKEMLEQNQIKIDRGIYKSLGY